MIQLKRAYEAASLDDGLRILVEWLSAFVRRSLQKARHRWSCLTFVTSTALLHCLHDGSETLAFRRILQVLPSAMVQDHEVDCDLVTGDIGRPQISWSYL